MIVPSSLKSAAPVLTSLFANIFQLGETSYSNEKVEFSTKKFAGGLSLFHNEERCKLMPILKMSEEISPGICAAEPSIL